MREEPPGGPDLLKEFHGVGGGGNGFNLGSYRPFSNDTTV